MLQIIKSYTNRADEDIFYVQLARPDNCINDISLSYAICLDDDILKKDDKFIFFAEFTLNPTTNTSPNPDCIIHWRLLQFSTTTIKIQKFKNKFNKRRLLQTPTTASPTHDPTSVPTSNPTTAAPTRGPIGEPTTSPTTAVPTRGPIGEPTSNPTTAPTRAPIGEPTTEIPTAAPTDVTTNPTSDPTPAPTAIPTESPTDSTINPTANPTIGPTAMPTESPTNSPSASPTNSPIASPSPPPVPTSVSSSSESESESQSDSSSEHDESSDSSGSSDESDESDESDDEAVITPIRTNDEMQNKEQIYPDNDDETFNDANIYVLSIDWVTSFTLITCVIAACALGISNFIFCRK